MFKCISRLKLSALLIMSLIAIKPLYAKDIDLSEYLRLEVISKTLHKRAIEHHKADQTRYDQLIKNQYSAFRDAMQKFIIDSTEERAERAVPPNGYMGANIDWAALGPGKQALDFKRVPQPWFNLQATIILDALAAIDPIFQNKTYDRDALITHFATIKTAVLAWQRPPLAKMN